MDIIGSARKRALTAIAAALAVSIALVALTGCSGANTAGSAQGLTLLAPNVEKCVDLRSGKESEDAGEFLAKVMTVPSTKKDGLTTSSRKESYAYYDANGKELFRLTDFGNGRYYELTIGSNSSTWTF